MYLERGVVDGTGDGPSRKGMLVLLLLQGAQLLHNVWLLQQVEVLLLLLVVELMLGVANLLLLLRIGGMMLMLLQGAKGEGGSPFLYITSCLNSLNLDWMMVEGGFQNRLEMWRRQRETGWRQRREA